MITPFSLFKDPEILEVEKHRDLKILKPLDFSFTEDLEIVPLTFSELLSVSMYYPVMFGTYEGTIFPFAVLGINRKNIYLDSTGNFKVEVIPKVIQAFPFGVIKKVIEEETNWIIIFDKSYVSEKGYPLFEEDGQGTSFLESVKGELSELALDFEEVYKFSREIFELGCLRPINLDIEIKIGRANFKNVLVGNIDVLAKLAPEKLYFLNTSGFLPVIYSIYFSVRNFKLFDFIAKD